MFSKSSFTYKSSSFSYSSSSSSTSNYHNSTQAYQHTTSSSPSHRSGQTLQQTTSSNPSGTTMYMQAQNLGGPIIQETRRFDANGRQILEDGRTLGYGNEKSGGDLERRIEDVSDEERVPEERRR